MPEISVDFPCPGCKEASLIYRSTELEIPFFGKATQTTLICGSCGYKHNDIILSELKEPTQYSVPIESEDDMSVKVVRSASATVSVPELGLKVEPGVASEGYITNVEGVLVRFRDAVGQAIRFAVGTEDEEASRIQGEEILKRIESTINGNEHVTLILNDPFGNSAILSERASKIELTEEEANELHTGYNIVDLLHSENE